MTESPGMMLSRLTVGDKQHPKLGGCVGAFFQVFDRNPRISGRQFFSPKHLPAERPRHASNKVRDDNKVPMAKLLLIADENREDLEGPNDCKGSEGGKVDIMASSGTLSEGENNDKPKRRSPGVIARLMGLESLPTPECEQKESYLLIKSSTVHVEASHLITTQEDFALERGLPDEETKDWLDDFDGKLGTILSALQTHKSNASCPATPQTGVDIGDSCLAFEYSLKPVKSGPSLRSQKLAAKLEQVGGAKSLKIQLTCSTGDRSALDQIVQRGRDGCVCGKVEKRKNNNDNLGGKRLQAKVSHGSMHDASMKINHSQEVDEKRSCKQKQRRIKIDQGSLSLNQLKGQSAEQQKRAGSVDEACNYGDCKINTNRANANLWLPPSNNNNNSGLYYKSKTKVAVGARVAMGTGHLDDPGERLKGSKFTREAQRERAEPAAERESFSLMKTLIKRRAAREAAAAAAMEAAGLLGSPPPSSTAPLPSTERREKLSAGRSEAGVVSMTSKASHDKSYVLDFDRRLLMNVNRNTAPSTSSSPVPGGVQLEICGQSTGKTTAAILQDVISALNGDTEDGTLVIERRTHRDDDGGDSTSSTAQGHDTDSTSDSVCWEGTGQPSPDSVLVSPFDDEGPPRGDHNGYLDDTWRIRSEEDYVAAVLAARSESGPSSTSRDARRQAALFRKLEARVVAGWPDSEVAATRAHRLLVFDCVREAVEGEAVAWTECKPDRWRWQRQQQLLARAMHDQIRGWRDKGAGDLALDDLVEADLRKICNRWSGFEPEGSEIVSAIERILFRSLVEELVCDLVRS